MQELESVPGLAGRLFGGGAAANVNGNGILRRHGPSAARQEASAADEVRCPRCDSANTKFCYYNNYNLAQPRHFCRACRRYWTKGGHLRNVPVGGGCRKPKPRRHAPAADGVHAAGRDGKAPRSGCAGLATDGDAPVPSAFSAAAVTEPSGTISGSRAEATAGARTLAAGDARAPLVPPPAPMFADQAPVFASLFAPPRPLPAFISCSAQPKAGERVASLLAMQQSPSSAADAAGTAAPSCAGAPDWPTAASDEAGVFELAGGIAGDASWTAYWNPAGSWTDADPTIYLP